MRSQKICTYLLLLCMSLGVTRQAQCTSSSHQKKEPAPKFSWPLYKNDFWISCHFGTRKNRLRPHSGLDLAALKGKPVFAAASGKVQKTGMCGGYGKRINIYHGKRKDISFKTRYAHLDRILVKPHQKVKRGDLIGFVGKTGNVTGKNGEHLHFEIIRNDKVVNPLDYLPSLKKA